MLLSHILEPIPAKKVTYKKRNDQIYVYYTVKAYRNKHGKPTSDEVSIGKKDPATGKLIPNERYFMFFPERKPKGFEQIKPIPITEPIHQIKNCGDVAAMYSSAQSTGLINILQDCFPLKWDKILTVACFIVGHSNSMMYIEDWLDETDIPFSKHINNIDCSKLFSSISYEERQLFFAEWIKYQAEQEYIVFDVTSISSYSNDIEIAEFGYNRDNDNLPQINYGMFYGINSDLPVYYNVYNGSILDKSYLQFIMTNAIELGVNNACFVVDNVLATKDNISFMADNNFDFITSIPSSYDESKKLIDLAIGNIENIENLIDDYQVFGKQFPFKFHDIDLVAHVYFSAERKMLEMATYHRYLDKLKKDLEDIKNKNQIKRRHKEYFKITEETSSSFTYELDVDKVNLAYKRMGFYVLITTKDKINSEHILKTYRDKNVIEENFNQLKNGLEFKRIKTHCDKTTEGKLFVGFIALIIRSYMRSNYKKNDTIKRLTFEKILAELRKIKVVTYSTLVKKITPLTKLQKTILDVFKIEHKLFTEKCIL